MSTIALCIPAYNAAWCLPRLLKSAKKQIIAFDEILVYNDCSTDNTEEIAIKHGAKVINGSENKGCSFGKNKLAAVAKSEWIHFHDADDDLLPNFTEVAHEWLKKNENPDILLLNFEYKDFDTGKILGYLNYNREKLLKDTIRFVLENKIVNFAICNTKKFIEIGGFDLDPEVLYNEDRAFYIRAATNGLSFDYEPRITCINFSYSVSMSNSNQLKCIEAYLKVSEKAIAAVGNKYQKEIALGLWNNATLAASYKAWDLVKENIHVAVKLNGRTPLGQKLIVNILSFINPYLAYWIREKLIRLLKPQMRKNNYLVPIKFKS
ncbi:MAG: glycosyltransferase family 2 protein [Flavobacterium sp.]|nr:MAG: glycosyltransferase family 2 protein [Flavobacterium sp.]